MKFMNVKAFFLKYWPQNIVKEYNTHVKIILENGDYKVKAVCQ